MPFKTLIEDALENVSLFPSSVTCCISVNETAIEKWVGLTRRIMAIERKYHYDDPTLVRHIYDLNAIKQANMLGDNFSILAKSVVNYDAEQFKNQHPEYSFNPVSEILRSLEILKNKIHWKERYQEFIETMVYDIIPSLNYDHSLTVLEDLSKSVLGSM